MRVASGALLSTPLGGTRSTPSVSLNKSCTLENTAAASLFPVECGAGGSLNSRSPSKTFPHELVECTAPAICRVGAGRRRRNYCGGRTAVSVFCPAHPAGNGRPYHISVAELSRNLCARLVRLLLDAQCASHELARFPVAHEIRTKPQCNQCNRRC